MKTYILSIVSMAILSSAILIIFPKGKIENVLKCVLSCVCALVIIMPLSKGVDFDFDKINLQLNANFNSENFDEFLTTLKIDTLKENILKSLSNLGINDAVILIDYNGSDDCKLVVQVDSEYKNYNEKVIEILENEYQISNEYYEIKYV